MKARICKGWVTGILLAAMAINVCGCSKFQPVEKEEMGYNQIAPEDVVTDEKKEEPFVFTLPTQAEASSIYVEKVEGISEDFIRGMDISSVLSQEKSGVKYYNEAGEEMDLFRILAEAGYNYIRVRVWNHPFDDEGRGYGGGNCDVAAAAEIGKRAAEYGMKLSVDFHYSDFWADPSKQSAPREWKRLLFTQKQEAIYNFTKESLQTIIDAGADVGMVQIGNETNNAMAGEKDYEKITVLMKEASKAIREVASENDKDIQVAVHYTNIEDTEGTIKRAKDLEDAGVDYDIFGVSYYAFWHGTMDNLTEVLKQVNEQYGKKTCVMETSYAYTLDDGDGFGNSVSEKDLAAGYAATVQSQATCIRDVCAAVAAAGDSALGVFYWEGAWTPVGPATADNSPIWEEYGSGWASSYSAKYDPHDAGLYYGGCSWDNQALFDFNGKALPSLNVFKYLYHGTTCEPKVDYVEECSIEINVGEEAVLPEAIAVVMNNRALSGDVAVTWNAEDVAKIDTGVMADYVVNGVLEDGTAVSCTVSVANVNYLQNPSFEDKNYSMWNITAEGDNPTDYQKKTTDAKSGEMSLHFWSESEMNFKVEQTVSGLEAGKYTFEVCLQGGDVGSNAQIYSYAIVGDQIFESEAVKLDGWVNWQTPIIRDISVLDGEEVTVGVRVKAAAKGWGTMDDFYLYKQ